MLCREVQDYLEKPKGLPFFYVVGDKDYRNVLENLKQADISVVRMSEFCSKDDKFPNVDVLVDYLRTSDVDCRENRVAVIGLGEALALRGAAFADMQLRRLKDTTIGNARVILLLRGVSALATSIIMDDNSKMANQKRAYISADTSTNISITNVQADVGLVAKAGVKHLLEQLEDGACGALYASTSLILDQALFSVCNLSDAHSVIKLLASDFALDSELGTEEQWRQLLEDLHKCNRDINAVFQKYSIDKSIVDDLRTATSGIEYKNWLIFLYLKLHADDFGRAYLKFVMDTTSKFDDLKTNLLVKITEVSHHDENFSKFYDDRKKLVQCFPEEDLAIFIRANDVVPEEAIYRLTDNTKLEKKAVVQWIAHNGLSDAIAHVYPALHAYLQKYRFDCPALAEELTEYFDSYKRQKVLNTISDEFLKLVERNAEKPLYGRLPSRDEAINAIPDKNDTYLYWIDALGVEYLAYISSLAREKNLSMQIDIARADLPTITSMNRKFYDEWTGREKYKDERLDKIKHKEEGGYFFNRVKEPIHIPAELDVIKSAMDTAATELGMNKCKSFVIASDHGASRLAVIKNQEVPYDTDTKGEHSGRCCRAFDGCDLPYKVEENGFICLGDYGRFRGSRAANVEVHGGASLEEIVVPVITLTLKKQTDVEIAVLYPENITADKMNGVTLQLHISYVTFPNKVSLLMEEKRYYGNTTDQTHYTFTLADIKRARSKPYEAEVYDGADLIGKVSFQVKGKTAKMNEYFDFDGDF